MIRPPPVIFKGRLTGALRSPLRALRRIERYNYFNIPRNRLVKSHLPFCRLLREPIAHFEISTSGFSLAKLCPLISLRKPLRSKVLGEAVIARLCRSLAYIRAILNAPVRTLQAEDSEYNASP